MFQDYLEIHIFKGIPNSQFQLSFAGTLMEVFVNLMGPISQIIASRFGPRAVLVIGTILATLGLELASLSKEVYMTRIDVTAIKVYRVDTDNRYGIYI